MIYPQSLPEPIATELDENHEIPDATKATIARLTDNQTLGELFAQSLQETISTEVDVNGEISDATKATIARLADDQTLGELFAEFDAGGLFASFDAIVAASSYLKD